MSISRALAYYAAGALMFGFIASVGVNIAGQGREAQGLANPGDLLMVAMLVVAALLAFGSILAAIVARAAREARDPNRTT